MVMINFDIPEKENNILEKKSKEWNLNKVQTLLKIIREMEEK